MAKQRNLNLAEAATMFLSTLSPEQKQQSQQELNKFVLWYRSERLVSELTPREIAEYAERMNSLATDPVKKLEPVKAFLSYTRKEGLTTQNLAVHLRPSKTKGKLSTKRSHKGPEPVTLTSEGFTAMESELASLKSERPNMADQLRQAAADKDFRENAPLEAAREHQGQVEARIRELESTLSAATILKQSTTNRKRVGIGSKVVLHDLASGEQISYNLVSPSEAKPAEGKLSIASPTGKALLEQEIGVVVEVIAPLGTLSYKIEDIQG
ncbi:GreA/GreB family elongation factor [Chloroflexota bacterium]